MEQIIVQGEAVKIKKIIAAKAPIPTENSSASDEVFDGIKVENLPKNMDFHPSIRRMNKVISSPNFVYKKAARLHK